MDGEWRTVPLGSLLPQSTIDELEELLKEIKSGRDLLIRERLLSILDPHRKYLEDRGVIVEYLAYYLESFFHRKA